MILLDGHVSSSARRPRALGHPAAKEEVDDVRLSCERGGNRASGESLARAAAASLAFSQHGELSPSLIVWRPA